MALITVLTDEKNVITKTIQDKNLTTVASGHITKGTGQAHNITLEELQSLIESLTQHQCLSLGVVEEQGFDSYPIYSKYSAKPGQITRSSKDFTMSDQGGFLLVDIDGHDLYDVIAALIQIDPDIESCGMLAVPSCSSWLWDDDNEKWLKEGGNSHLYIEVTDGSLIPAYGQELFKRLILNGYGNILVAKTSGTCLLRSIVDDSVWKSSNREIFESNPVCCDGVISKRLDKIEFEKGDILDISKSLEFIQLSSEEEILYSETVSALKEDPEIVKLSSIEYRKGLKVRATRSGISIGDLLKTYEDGMALGASEIIKDNAGDPLKILDIIKDPLSWKDKGIPDPIDFYKRGNESLNMVGRDIARVRYDEGTGRIYIYSFYGSIEYDLLWDFNSILSRISSLSTQIDLEDWLDELFDVDAGTTWTGYRLSSTELNEIAKVIAKKFKSFGSPSKYGSDATSSKNALKSLNSLKIKSTPIPLKIPPFIQKINKHHGIGMYGGKARIITESYKEELHFWEPQFLNISELKSYYAEDRVVIRMDGRPKEVDVFSAWEINQDRNKFDRVVFQPRNDLFRGCGASPVLQQGGHYNMWMGYLANLSNACSCDKILWHLEHIWCSGNKKWYDWILKWFSVLFQTPDSIGQPFPVLKSQPGAGKNIIIDHIICRLLGVHAISTSNKKDIIGDFNHRLGMNVFCFLNEAFFAGDKSDRSAMKTLIDEHRTITKKYVDSEHSRNMTKVIIASNEENVTGAEAGDRRYFYLPVSDQKAGDSNYFKELRMEIENGGRESFLKFMLDYESEIDLSLQPEQDSAFNEQRLQDILFGAETPVKFLYDLISNGVDINTKARLLERVDSEDLRELGEWGDNDILIHKSTLLELYIDYCSRYRKDGRFGLRDMQSLFAPYGKQGLKIYASIKYDKQSKEKFPMAAFPLKKGSMIRLWGRQKFKEEFQFRLLSGKG